MKRCDAGHYYDERRYASCPYCGTMARDAVETAELGKRPIDEGMAKTEAGGRREDPLREAVTEMHRGTDDMRTVGIYKKQTGMDAVVGWLVCTEGPEKGRDYKLHAGRNFIGRSAAMDICIAEDHMISRENHASVIYEPKHSDFYLAAGSGSTVTLDGKNINEVSAIHDRCVIGLGESTFTFVALCKGGFKWL